MKRATGSGTFTSRHCHTPISMVFFYHYKYAHTRRSPHLTLTLTNYLIKYPKFSYFFKMISDLNFYSIDEGNYTAEEPSGSSFLAGIFPNYGQTDSYSNQVQNIISNFNQGGYCTNCPYDSSIYPHLYPYIYSNNIIY
jgi:hypothetical protein